MTDARTEYFSALRVPVRNEFHGQLRVQTTCCLRLIAMATEMIDDAVSCTAALLHSRLQQIQNGFVALAEYDKLENGDTAMA